jgi:hypothetical protein
MHRTAARHGHIRGITAWEIRSTLPDGQVRILPDKGLPIALARWRRQAADPERSLPKRGALHLISAAYSTLNALVCRPLGLPLGAFTPHVALVFEKAGSAPR